MAVDPAPPAPAAARPSPEAWAARLAQLRRSAGGFRGLFEEILRLAGGTGVVDGMALYWKGGEALQLAASGGRDILPEDPAERQLQVQSFERAAAQAMETGRRIVLRPGESSEGRPAAELLHEPWTEEDFPLLNATDSTEVFVPIVLGDQAVGALSGWWQGEEGVAVVPELLRLAAVELSRFLQEQGPAGQARLLAETTAQVRLLEATGGQRDKIRFGILLTNYIRQLTGSSRVTLFAPHSPAQTGFLSQLRRGAVRYRLLGASGLNRVSERSAEAIFLRDTVHAMIVRAADQHEQALRAKKKGGKGAGDGESVEGPEESQGPPIEDPTRVNVGPPLVVLARRAISEEKKAQRDRVLREYFEESASDWILALALRREDGRFIGFLACEGRGEVPDMVRLRESFARLDLPVGRNLDQLLYWTSLRGRLLATLSGFGRKLRPKRGIRRWLPILIPVAVVLLLSLPLNFRIKGNSDIVSSEFRTVAAPFSGELDEVIVERGDLVAGEEVLGRMDLQNELLRQQELQAQLRGEEMQARLSADAGEEAAAARSRLQARVLRAELAVVRNRIEEGTFRAPFGGVIVGPEDLGESEGSYLDQGRTVFQLAALEDFELVVRLREQDFRYLRDYLAETGQPVEGVFRPEAEPGLSIPFAIEDLDELSFYTDSSVPGEIRIALRIPLEWSLGEDWPEATSELSGRARMGLGQRAAGFVLFRDFLHFLRTSFFF